MSRRNIIIIIIIVLIVLGLGAYLILTGSNKGAGILGNGGATPSHFMVQGVTVDVLKQGSGPAAKAGDNVTVNYVGTLSDGKKFDSSIDRNAPFTFPLGKNRVIKGFDLGVSGMKVGEERKITIPPELGYGSAGFLTIPKNATLIYDVTLLKINQ